MVWVCKARCHSREEKHTPTQKHDTEDANIHQQQTQQKPEVQDPLLSQGQRKQFNHPENQPQGTREQLSQQNQVEQQNQRNLWDRCLRGLQQTHQCQREIQHSQQQVQFEPFHQQFTDEMQKVQDKVKQEKWFQKWRQEFKDQVQTQQPDEEECPIPPDYRQAPKQPTQQPLNGQYQPQQPQNLTQNPQAPSQYWKQPPHVPHYLQPRYQVWHHPYYQPWQPQPQSILWTLQAQYQNLDQQIRQLRWQQWLQSQKQQCEVQNQKRFQTWQQQASQQLTKWQQAQYNARRERHQLRPREGEKQSRAHDESGIPDFPPSPFGTNEDSNNSDEGYPDNEEGEYESQGERDGSDNDPESHRETESESKVEEDKDEDDEEDNLGSESGFVFI